MDKVLHKHDMNQQLAQINTESIDYILFVILHSDTSLTQSCPKYNGRSSQLENLKYFSLILHKPLWD